MKTQISFYKSEVSRLNLESKKASQKIMLIGALRFLVFILTLVGIYLSMNSNAIVPILIVGISGFIVLLKKHNAIKKKRHLINELLKINTLEIDVINGNNEKLVNGDEFMDSSHYYSYDIDLFGEGSLFKHINRTSIKTATKKTCKNNH
jgi:hypothetical protein